MKNKLLNLNYSQSDDDLAASQTDDDLCSDLEDLSVNSKKNDYTLPFIRPITTPTKTVKPLKKEVDELSDVFGQLALGSKNSPLSKKVALVKNGLPADLRGIVYRMDNKKQRAYVRVVLDQDVCHASLLPSSQYSEVDIKHLYIPYTNIIANKDDVDVGSHIRIFEYSGARLVTCLQYAKMFANEDEAEITKYEGDDLVADRKANELVAVTSINANFVKVVGSEYGSSESVAALPWNRKINDFKGLTLHSFLYGELFYLPKFYIVELEKDVPKLIFDHAQRLCALKLYEDRVHAQRLGALKLYEDRVVPNASAAMMENKSPTTVGRPFIRRLRHLTSHEIRTIEHQTRNLTEEITYNLAVQYIRDVALTCAYLEDFVAKESVKEFTCDVSNIEFGYDTISRRDVIYVPLTYGVKKCLTVRGRDTWHLGSDLVLSNKLFLGKYGLPVIIDNTGVKRKNKKYIRLIGGPGSNNVLEAIKKHKGNIDWSKLLFGLGPMDSDNNSNADAIRKRFGAFYKNRFDLFQAYIGRSAAPDMNNISKLSQDFIIKGQKLDKSQRIAMRTAAGLPGFTCVSAPPGSGKTFMISGLVAAKLEENRRSRFAISATTNIAVTNAVETVHEKFPEIKKVRQFSRKAEAELGRNAKILDISLSKMTRDSTLVKKLMVCKDFAAAVVRRNAAQEQMKEHAPDVATQLGYVEAYQKAETRVGVTFIKAYGPTVYGTTGSILARDNHEGIEHLIVDEAAQMSQVEALSLYCRLPDVKYITLVGDSRQLGPFTDMAEGSLPHKLMKVGELTRLEKMQSSAKRELQFIYRCHPRIIDVLLKPIYGNQLQAGTPASARSLARDMDLPRAKDKSPCLFVQVDGKEEGGRNKEEAQLVVDFLYKLKRKGIKPEEVNVICHHRAQREELCRILKGKGSIGHLNLLYGVNTVDSYQGKEAKVVLILTTKTCDTWRNEIIQRTFSFISDPNRETVAVSRAQHAIYIFGDWPKLAQMPFWNQFGAGIVKSGAIVNKKWKHISDPGWIAKPNMIQTPLKARARTNRVKVTNGLKSQPPKTKMTTKAAYILPTEQAADPKKKRQRKARNTNQTPSSL